MVHRIQSIIQIEIKHLTDTDDCIVAFVTENKAIF